MDIRQLFTKVLDLADSVNDYLPASGLTQGGIDLARKVVELIDTFGEEIPLDQQEEAQAVRAVFAEKVKAKAADTSSRLRGGG